MAGVGSSGGEKETKKTVKTTLAVWLWVHHIQKRHLDGLSQRYNVNFSANVVKGDKVDLDVISVMPNISSTSLDAACRSVEDILEDAKAKKPAMRDVSDFGGAVEGAVSPNLTGCHICRSPDGRTVLIGPTLIKVNDVIKAIKSSRPTDSANKRGSTGASKPLPTKKATPATKTERGKTNDLKSGLVVDKHEWVYVNHVCADKLRKACTTYTPKEVPLKDKVRVVLTPSNAGTHSAYLRISRIMNEFEGKISHDEVSVNTDSEKTKFDRARPNKEAVLYREDSIIHIITLQDKKADVKEAIDRIIKNGDKTVGP